MRLYAIGDLHLSGGDDKPMDIFGSQWNRHFFHISEHWRSTVTESDTVLIPGDISWAMHLEDAVHDLEEIARLPGEKILCKGNHDYWWNSITQIRAVLPSSMTALQHNAVDLGSCVVCGTRGWVFDTASQPLDEQDRKICFRELQRLRLALEEAKKKAGNRPVIVMMHYPPLLAGETDTPFTRLLEEFHVHTTVYGHLHGQGIENGFTGGHNGVRYMLVSCDSIDFSPKEIQLP